MRVLKLVSENFKRLKFIEITPEGHVVLIRGLNEQGKSSALDSIWVGLKGKAVAPPAPIRNGQEVARIVLHLGDEQCEYKITRTFRRSHVDGKEPWDYTTDLKITDADDLPIKKTPQALLDSFTGALTFDPLEFLRMKPGEQFQLLGEKFVPGFNFTKHERLQDSDYEKRADVNKRAEQAKAAADVMVVAENPPGTRADITALSEKLREAGEHNQQLQQRRDYRARIRSSIDDKRLKAKAEFERAAELRRQTDEIEKAAAAAANLADRMESALDSEEPVPDPTDTAQLVAQIDAATRMNEAIDAWQKDRDRKAERAAFRKALEKESADLTAQMKAREEAKNAAIAAAKMPVEGLGFGKNVVLYNDLPLEQAADSVQLRTSVAIGMSMNQELRIILISGGERLDRNNFKVIAEMAREEDYDVWIEQVGDEGDYGFILEDGQIRGHEEQVAA